MGNKEIRVINAIYNENHVRVYQAYNHKIANECMRLGTFGESFKRGRMTWIKPSFLWMMYRSGWATKDNQECILGIDISREGFDEILSSAVLSNYEQFTYQSYERWTSCVKNSNVRCQWDPDRDIYGNRLEKRAIQIGLQGNMVDRYIDDWVLNIEDITEKVKRWRQEKQSKNLDIHELPPEVEYPVSDIIKKRLGMVQ